MCEKILAVEVFMCEKILAVEVFMSDKIPSCRSVFASLRVKRPQVAGLSKAMCGNTLYPVQIANVAMYQVCREERVRQISVQ